jgi:hypothetical protein
MEASLFIQTSIEGGSMDKEVTDIAVIACFSLLDFAEITHTVDVIPLMEAKKPFFKSDSVI